MTVFQEAAVRLLLVAQAARVRAGNGVEAVIGRAEVERAVVVADAARRVAGPGGTGRRRRGRAAAGRNDPDVDRRAARMGRLLGDIAEAEEVGLGGVWEKLGPVLRSSASRLQTLNSATARVGR